MDAITGVIIALGLVLLLISLFLLLSWLADLMKWQVSRIRFRKTFGVWPEDPTPIVGALVDAEIARRAQPFFLAWFKEWEALEKALGGQPRAFPARPIKEPHQLSATIPNVRPHSKEVATLLRRVRNAQDLARRFDYLTRSKLWDYAPPELQEKYKRVTNK